HTLAEIAAEKAAIIRSGVTAVVGPQDAAAMQVIVRQCRASGVEPRFVNTDRIDLIDVSPDGRFRMNFKTNSKSYEKVPIGLRGRNQIGNAAIAVLLAEALRDRGFATSQAAIVQGVETAAHHPGRLELWESEPNLLFDGAHNPAAAHALRGYLD